jgi:hypothetical protein
MAENLSALEYKTQEEILTVIRHITAVLSVSGVQVVDTLQHRLGNPSMEHDSEQPVRIYFGSVSESWLPYLSIAQNPVVPQPGEHKCFR